MINDIIKDNITFKLLTPVSSKNDFYNKLFPFIKISYVESKIWKNQILQGWGDDITIELSKEKAINELMENYLIIQCYKKFQDIDLNTSTSFFQNSSKFLSYNFSDQKFKFFDDNILSYFKEFKEQLFSTRWGFAAGKHYNSLIRHAFFESIERYLTVKFKNLPINFFTFKGSMDITIDLTKILEILQKYQYKVQINCFEILSLGWFVIVYIKRDLNTFQAVIGSSFSLSLMFSIKKALMEAISLVIVNVHYSHKKTRFELDIQNGKYPILNSNYFNNYEIKLYKIKENALAIPKSSITSIHTDLTRIFGNVNDFFCIGIYPLLFNV
jgi:hypothetical protein